MSLTLFETNIPNNFIVPTNIMASFFRTDTQMRTEFQDYNNEYADNLNPIIIEMFTKTINAYNNFISISRNINQNSPNISEMLNVYNSLDNEAREQMDRSRNINIIVNRTKIKIWLILFSTEHLKEIFDLLEDLVLLYHVTTKAYSDSNSSNEVLRNLIPKVETLLNDVHIYIDRSHNFRVSLNQYISSITNNLNQSVRNIERSFTTEYEELKESFAEFHDRLDEYSYELNEQMQLLHANGPHNIVNNEVMTGPAWEVHNYFASLNMQRIEQLMTQYNAANQQNPNTIDTNINSISLFKPLLIFIQKSNLFPLSEKDNYTSRLNFINDYIRDHDENNDLDRLRHIIDIALEFVIKHNDDYISEYIRSYIDACLNAYANNGVSCVAGMIERIVSENGIIVKAICVEGCDPLHTELDVLFNKTLNDVIQEWANTFLEGGPQENVLENMTPEQRKQHLIQFIRDSYNNIIDANMALKIAEEVNNYETMGVFTNLHFGGKRKQTNKKRTNKKQTNKKQTNKKRTKRKRTKRKY